MNATAFLALLRRDLRLFFLDKRAMTMSFVAPIVIASFFGYLFGGAGNSGDAAKIAVAAVDRDASAVSKRVVAGLASDKSLDVKPAPLEDARAAVRAGKTVVAVVIPPGFGDAAARSFFRREGKPDIELLYDPSHSAELSMVRGVLTQHVMEAVSAEATSPSRMEDAMREAENATGLAGADKRALVDMLAGVRKWQERSAGNGEQAAVPGFTLPYDVKEEAVTARKGVTYNAMAHSFAGMSVQFVLFMGIDAGLVVLAQRRSGIWKRLRAAPISRATVIGSRAASATVIAMLILTVVFAFARVVFGVRVEGSAIGLVGVCAAFSLMTATFGLLIAALGKTPEGTRGMSILVTLVLVMLGGSWVPAFLFPAWLQRATFAVPTRWAVDGLDAMLWRGLGLDTALPAVGALLGFALLFGVVAVWRFRWEADA